MTRAAVLGLLRAELLQLDERAAAVRTAIASLEELARLDGTDTARAVALSGEPDWTAYRPSVLLPAPPVAKKRPGRKPVPIAPKLMAAGQKALEQRKPDSQVRAAMGGLAKSTMRRLLREGALVRPAPLPPEPPAPLPLPPPPPAPKEPPKPKERSAAALARRAAVPKMRLPPQGTEKPAPRPPALPSGPVDEEALRKSGLRAELRVCGGCRLAVRGDPCPNCKAKAA